MRSMMKAVPVSTLVFLLAFLFLSWSRRSDHHGFLLQLVDAFSAPPAADNNKANAFATKTFLLRMGASTRIGTVARITQRGPHKSIFDFVGYPYFSSPLLRSSTYTPLATTTALALGPSRSRQHPGLSYTTSLQVASLDGTTETLIGSSDDTPSVGPVALPRRHDGHVNNLNKLEEAISKFLDPIKVERRPCPYDRQEGQKQIVSVLTDVVPHTTINGGGIQRIEQAFASCKARGEAAFITFVTAGYPRPQDTPSIMLAMQEGGASIIELGVPYTDPKADGPTIQKTNEIALQAGTNSVQQCLDMVQKARSKGLTVPVILMGYYNPFLQHTQNHISINTAVVAGLTDTDASSRSHDNKHNKKKHVNNDSSSSMDALCHDAAAAGVDGFLIVDLPPDGKPGVALQRSCQEHGLSTIPLIGPTTSKERICILAQHAASTFLYCVSITGTTGTRSALPDDLPAFVARVRSQTDLPLAVGFGISDPTMVQSVANIADGVVVGSAVLKAIDPDAPSCIPAAQATMVRDMVSHLATGLKQDPNVVQNQATILSQIPTFDGESKTNCAEDDKTTSITYGTTSFGGQYVPEILSEALKDMEQKYNAIMKDPQFLKELDEYRRDYAGGPTPLYRADRLTELAGGATIWLKREDLVHTGSHQINNAIGQALLAKRAGKRRIVAETGGGDRGVAAATICAKLGLDCTVYMGVTDYERHKLNVFRMKSLGAKVVPVFTGQGKVKDAINEAMRDIVTNVESTHYLIGSAIGPHPFPTIVRDFQSVMGKEIKQQLMEKTGKLPDAIVACVGGGANAIGVFHPFINEKGVALYGVEAAGKGLDKDGQHCAALSKGTPGVYHGAYTYVMQQPKLGQTARTHSISSGLDYAGVGPEHAFLKDSGRATYTAVTDDQALNGFQLLCSHEGIIPALETSHAIYYAVRHLAPTLGPGKNLVINMNARGDKDVPQVARLMDWE
ncbi:hypothetical protein ACA910_008387 [Epithemia clementina (nom. ined.)]